MNEKPRGFNADAAMSILNLFSPSTSIYPGFRISALAAKKDQSRKKQRSSPTTRRDLVTDSDQLKKNGAPVKQGSSVSDVAVEERTRTELRSAQQAPDQNFAPGETNGKLLVADRVSVWKACVGTAVGLSVGGFLLRQVSHSGAEGRWVDIPDITTLMPLRTELWHVIPTVGVVVLVTSLRQILLQLWPDFAQSTQVANKQVLSSLEAVDIVSVSFLSGMSEEFLFRGALLPLFGPDWKGVLGAGVIFGALHVSGGRNASFAIWASFVGVVYGILGLYTCDLTSPMAAHSLANLFGAAIWKANQNGEESKPV